MSTEDPISQIIKGFTSPNPFAWPPNCKPGIIQRFYNTLTVRVIITYFRKMYRKLFFCFSCQIATCSIMRKIKMPSVLHNNIVTYLQFRNRLIMKLISASYIVFFHIDCLCNCKQHYVCHNSVKKADTQRWAIFCRMFFIVNRLSDLIKTQRIQVSVDNVTFILFLTSKQHDVLRFLPHMYIMHPVYLFQFDVCLKLINSVWLNVA